MIQVLFEDIFAQDVDAIVNPANKDMLHGGGLAAVIASRAGTDVVEASRRIVAHMPIETGEAIVTEAGELDDFQAIIHTVGPYYVENDEDWSPRYAEASRDQQDDQLADAYKNAIRLAAGNGLESIAFPAVSCGVFRFPVELAAPIAIKAIKEAMAQYPSVTDVRICVLEDAHYDAFTKALEAQNGE
jgi:O-acetyl-ADP-ribose deacetylase (regulator of RNase III)